MIRERFWNAFDWCVRYWLELAASIAAGVLIGFTPHLITRCG